MNFIDDQLDEEEVLKGVSMLQQELELEKSRNCGLVQKFESIKIQYDNDADITTELRKRIVKLENDLAEGLSKANTKRGDEEAVLSRLRTLLEKSETVRHQAEYTLLLEQKRLRENEEKFARREAKLKDEIANYKGLVTECTNRAKEWEHAVELTQKAADLEKENFDNTMDKITCSLKEKDSVIEFLNFEANEKHKQLEAVSKSFQSEKRLNEDVTRSLSKCHAAIQHQKDDIKQHCLKHAVHEQKERKIRQDVKGLHEELKSMENSLQKERGMSIQSNQQLAHLEQEMMLLERENRRLQDALDSEVGSRKEDTKQLKKTQEKSEKSKETIKTLQAELDRLGDTHHHTEERLTRELTEEKQKAANLSAELTEHQSICVDLAKELNALQTGMEQIDHQYGACMAELERVYCTYYQTKDNTSPMTMVSSLKQKLADMSDNAMKQENAVETLKRDVERHTSTYEIQRKSMESKSSAISSLQQQLASTSHQLSEQEQDTKYLGATNNTLQQQVQDITLLLGTEQEKTLTLLKDKQETIRAHHDYLKEQCETVRHIGVTMGAHITDTDWQTVCSAVLHAAQALNSEKNELKILLNEAQDELKCCHVSMEILSKKVDNTRVECSRKLMDNERVNSQHIQSLEDNYLRLIDTLHEKVQVSEVNTKSTNDKINAFYQENETLKEQVFALEDDLQASEKQRVNLQAAIGMLGSTVLHHTNRHARMLHLISVYKIQLRKALVQEEELLCLSDALADSQVHHHPIFKFRRCVIAVLALNRLKKLYRNRSTHPRNTTEWLEGAQLSRLISVSMKCWRTQPLAHTTDKLVSAIRNSNTGSNDELYYGELTAMLGRGLKYGSRPYILDNPVLNVRTFALSLTQRLHSVEIERRSLISKVAHWQKETTALQGAVEQTSVLSKKVQELEGMAFKTVPISKHESLLKELATVMSREDCIREEAHNLRQQLKRLEDSYEHTTNLLNEKTDTLNEAIRELSDEKIVHRQNELNQRGTQRKLSTLETDKKTLYDQLQTVQKCVDARSKERDALLSYLARLQTALEERKCRTTAGVGRISSTGYISTDTNSQEIVEVQRICALYEDILKLTLRRVATLERDVQSFKTHADSLKGELSAACQRLVLDDVPIGKPLIGSDYNRNEEFVPLQQRVSSDGVSKLGARVGQNFSEAIDNVAWS